MSGGLPARCATPLVNCESVENKLRHAVYKNWKSIQKYCRGCDSEGSGQIHPEDFKGKYKQKHLGCKSSRNCSQQKHFKRRTDSCNA